MKKLTDVHWFEKRSLINVIAAQFHTHLTVEDAVIKLLGLAAKK
jgi:hypothetical protein